MSNINVSITPFTLCNLLCGQLSLEACGALCNWLEEVGCAEPLALGDILVSYSEVPASWQADYKSSEIIAQLKNGNILVMN